MDFTEYDNECRSMGGLFQELAHEMKSSSAVWQEFTARGTKLHQTLGTSNIAISSFLDSLQKVADMANNSKGAVKDIGATLTRLCLRQRSMEEKIKEFVTILGGTFSPIPSLLDDWKKCVVQMDHTHGKDYKKLDKEIQKSIVEAQKLKKQIDKGGNAAKLQPSLDSKLQSLQFKYNDLVTNESVALKKLTLHERQRFSFFAKCLMPLLDKQSEMLTDLGHLDDVTATLLHQTKDSECIIKHCEDFVDEFRDSEACHDQIFVTPPSSPQMSRHSSTLSIRSGSSNYSHLKRVQQKQQHNGLNNDRNSEYSINTSNKFDTESKRSTLTQSIVDDDITPTVSPTVSPKNPDNNNTNNDLYDTLRRKNNKPKSSLTNSFFSNFKSSNTSLSKSSLRKSFSSKPTSSNLKRSGSKTNKGEVEDGEFLMGHREFNRNTLRNSIAVPNRKDVSQSPSMQSLPTKQPLQALESPLRPGRKFGGNSRLEADEQLRRAAEKGPETVHSSHYATLGRNHHRSLNPVRSSFRGTSISHAGRLDDSALPSPPPPPPIPIFPSGDTDEQIATLLRAGIKKTSAPLPPPQVRMPSNKQALQAQYSHPVAQPHSRVETTPKTAPPQRPPPFSYAPQESVARKHHSLHNSSTFVVAPSKRHSSLLKQQSPPALQHSPQIQHLQQIQSQSAPVQQHVTSFQQSQQQPPLQQQQQPTPSVRQQSPIRQQYQQPLLIKQQPQQPSSTQQSSQTQQPKSPQLYQQLQKPKSPQPEQPSSPQPQQSLPQSQLHQQQLPQPQLQKQQPTSPTSPSQPPQRPKYVPYSIQNNVIVTDTTIASQPPPKSPKISPLYKGSSSSSYTTPPTSPPTTLSPDATSSSDNNTNTKKDVTLIPIRILHKYSDGLAGLNSPEATPRINATQYKTIPPTEPKPYPPNRNSSMTFEPSEEQN